MTVKNLFGEEWYAELKGVLESDYFIRLGRLIANERSSYTIYPEKYSDLLFKAFRTTPISKVKVVILGQDPYHDGSYDGFAFSNAGKTGRLSPSLLNIFKEVEDDVYNGLRLDQDPNLQRWAEQGVLLINTAHTVRKGSPGWHLAQWEKFTTEVVHVLSQRDQHIVWMLWGRKAEDHLAGRFLHKKQLKLVSPHPSPYSASSGFFGCKHFSKCNKYLEEHEQGQIRW
jgi:uracil-DNA glycosylase